MNNPRLYHAIHMYGVAAAHYATAPHAGRYSAGQARDAQMTTVEGLIDAAILAEREACAAIADDRMCEARATWPESSAAADIAGRIRARASP